MGEDRDSLVSVTVPPIASQVADHHRRASSEIDGMSPSRKWTADTNLRGWRRCIKEIDPRHENGWAFSGVELSAGAMASLSTGTIVITCDVSWAKTKWYAGRYIKPIEIEASLYETTADGLTLLKRSVRRKWARDLVDWLLINRPNIPVKTAPILTREVV